ncbi:hypothetical protein PQO01_05455 [Lentisphaera marina]|uniref:hypothetical protein n=1 Tax=Lentisphaera marina TaxID=1111041 RepID=UPI002366A7E7|nr:hypothetical protein [Lentisphaera marina]MDD7984392.1 hypothetical protein [Lentisphaera marina]
MNIRMTTILLMCTLLASVSAQVTLSGSKDLAKQHWKTSGGLNVSQDKDVIILDDQSDYDSISLYQELPKSMLKKILKDGLELTFTSRISEAHPSGTGIEINVVNGFRLVLMLSNYQNKQNISFWDYEAKKSRGHQIKTSSFVNYRVLWTPADGGKVSVFVNGKQVITKSSVSHPTNHSSRITIGGLSTSKARMGKLELKNLELKVLPSP